MQKPTQRLLIITAILSLIIGFFLYNSSDTGLTEKPAVTTITNIPEADAPTLELTRNTVVTNKENARCTPKIHKEMEKFTSPKWHDFKENIYFQGMRYPVLQLAISVVEPIRGDWILSQKIEVEELSPRINTFPKLDHEQQMKLIGTILAEGVQGILRQVEAGEVPAEILTDSSHAIFEMLLELSKETKTSNILPTEEEMIGLIGYGLEITVNDYNSATRVAAPVEFLELLITLGPSPESANHNFEKIPLDFAAEQSDLELMNFWFKSNFLFSNKLHGGDFNDTLLLNATSSNQLMEYWEFLHNWGAFPRSPETARQLLSSRTLIIKDDLKQKLLQLANQKNSKIQLSPTDQSLYENAIEQIQFINQLIRNKFSGHPACFKKLKNLITEDVYDKQWVIEQLEKGDNVEDILKLLALQSAEKVDEFRHNLQRGLYKPFLLPDEEIEKIIIDENMQKAFGFAILKNWQALTDIIESDLLDDKAKIGLLSDGTSLKIPQQLREQLFAQIESLPISSYDKIATILDISTLENMDLSTGELNQIDPLGKNLFYYAAKRNNTELMRWLVEQNVDMDADPYGTDPLDAALQWNTHAETLATLCSLGYSLKPKHRKRFGEIRDEDPTEADEILENCPEFAE